MPSATPRNPRTSSEPGDEPSSRRPRASIRGQDPGSRRRGDRRGGRHAEHGEAAAPSRRPPARHGDARPEGAAVRARLRSHAEGLLYDGARGTRGRARDRPCARRPAPGRDRRVAARAARPGARRGRDRFGSVDLEVAVTAALDHETTQRLVQAVLLSPGFDRVLIQATDRALHGPEMQRVIEHVAASPEVRGGADARRAPRSPSEMVAGRPVAGRGPRRRRRAHGARMVATATPSVAPSAYAGIATRGSRAGDRRCDRERDVLLIAALVALVELDGRRNSAPAVARRGAGGDRLAARLDRVLLAVLDDDRADARDAPDAVARHRPRDGEPPHLRERRSSVSSRSGSRSSPCSRAFIPVLFDARRRGVHDMVARTVVVHAPLAR